jgi:hypothetical protein
MEIGQLESLPAIIECDGFNARWPNISRANLTGTIDDLFGEKKYRYTFNNLWNKKFTFCLELIGREFESFGSFKTTKE